jgi:hypothetical protein
MIIYAVEYNDGEDRFVEGLYSTEELAEASWHMRNEPKWHDITEYELDLDDKADEPDIDHRPRFGPKTQFQHHLNDMYLRMFETNLKAFTALSNKTAVPERTGNEIKFFSYVSKPTTESI